MKNYNTKRNHLNNSMMIVPDEDYHDIKETSRLIKELHDLLIGSAPQESALNGFIPEIEAKKLLNRKTTWFWNQRKNGKLVGKKLGSTVYYRKDDLLNLLNA